MSPAGVTASALRVGMTIEQAWHDVPGGTATSALQLMEALVERPDVEVIGVAARHSAPTRAAFRPPAAVQHLSLPRAVLYESWHALRWPPVQRATGPVDVIHATTPAIPPRSAPLVVTVHDLAFLYSPEHFTRQGNRFFRRGLDLTRRHADLVLVPSRATWDDCERAGIASGRLRLVPHGVRTRHVASDQVAGALARYGLERPYVMWCGTQEPRKNLSSLMQAFDRLARKVRDVDLVLVGPQGWGEAMGASAPPTERVHMLGFVDDKDLHALYAGARAFCYPSLREGFGMPVLEAMSHGVPVVTSLGTPMAELIRDGGLAVPATDVGAITDALLSVLGDEHDRFALGAHAASESHNWGRAADLAVSAYREVAAA